MGAIAAGAPYGGLSQSQNQQIRPDSIQSVLQDIEVDLNEAINSASNLSDKLRGTQPATPIATGSVTPPMDVLSRLQNIRQAVRTANGHLSNSHNAISG